MYCAIELQKKFIDNNNITVRVGIHSGEVIFKENNVFGDGVNIASRIESLGIPGAILVSKLIRDQLKNKGDVLLVSLGTFLFKNVTEALEVFAVANSGFVVPKRGEMQGKLQKGNSVNKKVVLPLIVLAILLLSYFIWTNFFSNDNATKIYEVKSTFVIDDETIEYNALVKLLFNENKATGVYINDIGERGIINGMLNNTSLDLTFNSILFAGECEFIGIIEEDKSAFKGKYSCTYDEFASTNAKEVSEANFALFTAKDSIYFVEN